ncbi:MAG: enoyl-CoA hydratase/isomerase family protein [Hyphomicrobiaceae bacterium]
MSSATPNPEPEVLIRIEGRAGRITLNRPKALNALTLGMVREIWAILRAWTTETQVELVVFDGAGDRAFCAGGDVLSLYESRAEGSDLARTFWREEYRLNALIHRYPKPVVAIMDGIVMGGGIGLSAHIRGGGRVVTDRSMLAMPETGIGLVPDVGGSWLLSHAIGELGTYLGLTGARMNGSDALQTGFADVYITHQRRDALVAALCDPKGPAFADIIDEAAESDPIPASPLMALKSDVDRCFSKPTVEAILAELQTTAAPWAMKTRADLLAKSPLAMKATLAALRRAPALGSLEEALNVEFRLCTHLFEHGEFPEGVRALLVDKDKSPRWRPPRLEDVSDGMVEALFTPLRIEAEPRLSPPSGI